MYTVCWVMRNVCVSLKTNVECVQYSDWRYEGLDTCCTVCQTEGFETLITFIRGLYLKLNQHLDL